MPGEPDPGAGPDPAEVAAELASLLEELDRRPPLAGAEAVAERHRRGADNLADYLALRRHDLRPLQDQLTRLGLSSLGRCEAHIRATLSATRRAGSALAGQPLPTLDASGFDDGPRTLAANAAALLGPAPSGRSVRIMVTLPTVAANDGGRLIASLLEAGMDCARINTAHDDPAAWVRMVEGVREASGRTGRHCTVLADLSGPKLRTGPLVDGARAVRIRPAKDEVGRVVEPAPVVLVAEGSSPPPVEAEVVPVTGPLLGDVVAGDEIALVDARGKPRSLQVGEVGDGWVVASVDRTTWVQTGCELRRSSSGAGANGRVGALPPRPRSIRLSVGDELVLRADAAASRPPARGEVASIGCTLPEALRAVRTGDRVEFDDGAMSAQVVAVHGRGVTVRIVHMGATGGRLRAEKGINLPDTDLPLDALGPDDLAALDAIGALVDAVGLSFVRRATDVDALHGALASRGIAPGVVLKVETSLAFGNLPQLLVAAMRTERCGVMIARGDLAIEAGYGRTAELQEEILWASEAAHLPVIWATQVLEGVAKEGRPSRAEITDAAAATRAECVMLNKGPHVVAAVSMLDDILTRMTGHQHKKRTLLRRLRSW